MSCRAAAVEFGLSKSAVERHKNGHLRPSIAAGNIMGSNSKPVPIINPKYPVVAPVEADQTDLSLLSIKKRLARLIDKLDMAVAEAADSGTFQGLSAVGGQLIKALDRACVLESHYPEKAPPGALPGVAAGFAVQIILPPGAPAAVALQSTRAPPCSVPEAPVIEIPFDELGLATTPAHVRAAAGRFHNDGIE